MSWLKLKLKLIINQYFSKTKTKSKSLLLVKLKLIINQYF